MVKSNPKTEKAQAPAGRYFEGIGRRKTAVARVRIHKGKGSFMVNNLPFRDYFRIPRLQRILEAPFDQLKLAEEFAVNVKVSGGGPKAQAEAVRHGLSRALVLTDEDLKKRLRKLGFLTRDPRMVERKKYGLKKARRAPQWAKR